LQFSREPGAPAPPSNGPPPSPRRMASKSRCKARSFSPSAPNSSAILRDSATVGASEQNYSTVLVRRRRGSFDLVLGVHIKQQIIRQRMIVMVAATHQVKIHFTLPG